MKARLVFQLGLLGLALGTGSLAAQTDATSVPLRYEANGAVILRGNAGSTDFTLRNPGKSDVPLALRAGAFTDDATGSALPAAKIEFTTQSGHALPAVLGSGAEIGIQASVSGLSGSNVATTTLFNANAKLGPLHLVEADAPLDITIDGNGGSDQSLVLTNGEESILTLRNNEAKAYSLDWSFQIGATTLQSGDLQLAPNGRAHIELTPTADLYSWTDNLRPSAKTGTLLLTLNGPPEVAKELLPQRSLRVSLQMRKFGTAWTSLFWHLFVALMLLLGGLLSVAGNTVLPNIMRKASLRRQLLELANRMTSVSTRVDPYLRTLLSMERKRIDLLLTNVWVISLGSAEKLDEISMAIEQVGRRLKMVERLDDLRRRLEESGTSVPPSTSEAIEDKLEMAATLLQPFVITPEDYVTASGYLDAAKSALENLGNTTGQAMAIAANFRELRVRQKLFPNSHYADLKAALPGLFEMLNQPFEDPANITRPMMFAIDYGIAALQLAFDYAGLRANSSSVPAGPASSAVAEPASAAGQNARERLVIHQEELIALLNTLTRGALRVLRTLVQEMRENIYERDVLEEIAAPGKAEIVLDPQVVRPYVPVLFSVRFKDPRFNGAAAIRRLSFKWEFPKFLLEQREIIPHFFRGNEPERDAGRDVQVSVRVESQLAPGSVAPGMGKAATTSLRSVLATTIQIEQPSRSSYSRAFAESVRFLIAYGVALAALLSGALQQLDKLDFMPAVIAIIALGFGADTVKNLLTQSARKAAA
ncbi:MAG TPA: hypothetical protein VFW25_06450 [Silvibacterium sp.]|nr:hypothetical protein [Silvibacterium sp.]